MAKLVAGDVVRLRRNWGGYGEGEVGVARAVGYGQRGHASLVWFHETAATPYHPYRQSWFDNEDLELVESKKKAVGGVYNPRNPEGNR